MDASILQRPLKPKSKEPVQLTLCDMPIAANDNWKEYYWGMPSYNEYGMRLIRRTGTKESEHAPANDNATVPEAAGD